MQKPASILLMQAMSLMIAFPNFLSGSLFEKDQNGSNCFPAVEKIFKQKKASAAEKPAVKPQKKEQAQPAKQGPSLSAEEKDLLARLVHAEAKGEPFKGKVAVAEVVLNRVQNAKFPDSVKEVIYQKRQFDPVSNGEINKPAGPDAKKAVDEAIRTDKKVTNALFFYNPEIATDTWIRTRAVSVKIGRHVFAS
ncbi:cell wall hydrolase [Neobacillus piezotolerans]|uniref:Cell wall hydrolase n=1 Tax=Neobacillus piezotolerans TaxID=2259171 RepID=A0A3D8GV49_9BACI|nr:cell wall hydrolase [Neobacillus piezotolerans]RDU38353.1 cell wall hydrolase [Neobacillus piezotolerans]